jgi:hypothetical protein
MTSLPFQHHSLTLLTSLMVSIAYISYSIYSCLPDSIYGYMRYLIVGFSPSSIGRSLTLSPRSLSFPKLLVSLAWYCPFTTFTTTIFVPSSLIRDTNVETVNTIDERFFILCSFYLTHPPFLPETNTLQDTS